MNATRLPVLGSRNRMSWERLPRRFWIPTTTVHHERCLILGFGVEVEHIHQIADSRRIDRDVRIAVSCHRVWQGVPSSRADRRQSPVRLNELENRDVVRVTMRDMASGAERRNDYHRNPRAIAK